MTQLDSPPTGATTAAPEYFPSLRRQDWLVHGVSTRLGGESLGHLASLNVSFAVGDDPARVVANRRRLCGALSIALEDVVCPVMTHGTRVAVVTGADRRRGALVRGTGIPDTDALISDQAGVYLLLTFADCVPILFADPTHRAVGLAHAGWKGSIADVAGATVAAMGGAFGTRPEDLLVAIGPSIGPCCYEVGPDVVGALGDRLGDPTPFLRPGRGDRPHLDLWALNRHWLRRASVPDERIELASTCTSCTTDWYYSHRAEAGRTGRFAVVIGRRA